ncbi:hypothetical protein SAMN02910369_01962 [Lachnospiraceae bacterium NE2001]|nr:hypothetical protein SAMN02910369_01962 [Lachnospiraceae bacterium NE2001]
MFDVNIEGIGNIETVKALFSSVNCLGYDNCFLVVQNYDYMGSLAGSEGQITTTNAAIVGAKAGGVAGGIVGGLVGSAVSNAVNEAVQEFHNSLDIKKKIVFDTTVYGGYLVNVLAEGVGIIPLSNGGKLTPSIKNFITDVANFVYFSNDEIESVKLENLPLRFSTKKLAIYFKGLNKTCPRWVCPSKNKLVPYQEENFKKLLNK